jgi:Tfp pilus assembly protein PilX
LAQTETESNVMHRTQTGERGQALIGTVISISIVLLVLLTAISITQLSNRAIARQLTYQGQALNAAEAGITETLSWFRRQNGTVTLFKPKLDTTVTPTIDETENTTIGIVRTFDLSKTANLKGRYECTIGTTSATTATGVLDVTLQVKPAAAAGTVWQLESTGYVWVVNDPSKTFNQSPNMVISKQTVRTQIQRMTLSLPEGGAAIFNGTGGSFSLGSKAKIQGGSGAGIAYSYAGTPAGGSVSGTPAKKASSLAGYSIPAVFSVTPVELAGLADLQVNKVSDLPNPMPAMSLIIINGNATFDAARSLVGSGILVVYGDLNLSGQNNSSYSGIVYVTGKFTMDQPSLISGAVIVGNGVSSGAVSIGNGGGGDVAEVDYDPSMISQITSQMGQYRFSRGMYWVGK